MSCCHSCHVGDPCETSCSDHGAKAFQNFKDKLAGLTVGSGEIKALDAKIRNLNSDIMSSSLMSTAEKSDWTTFELSWLKWASDHDTFLSQTGGDVGSEFDSFMASYNERLRMFQSKGGRTEAKPAEEDAPITGTISRATQTIVDGVLIMGGVYLLFKFLDSRKK